MRKEKLGNNLYTKEARRKPCILVLVVGEGHGEDEEESRVILLSKTPNKGGGDVCPSRQRPGDLIHELSLQESSVRFLWLRLRGREERGLKHVEDAVGGCDVRVGDEHAVHCDLVWMRKGQRVGISIYTSTREEERRIKEGIENK